jgi:hypothetical protein
MRSESVQLERIIGCEARKTQKGNIYGKITICFDLYLTLPLQNESLSADVKCFALMLGRALVRISAVISSVGQ